MKSVLNFVVVALIAVLPALSNAATCAQAKSILLNEINSGIETFPGSCRPLALLKCGILFNTKLPQLRGVITKDEHAKLKLVVQGVNDNIEMIKSIVSDDYAAPMNTLIRDLNIYNKNCAK